MELSAHHEPAAGLVPGRLQRVVGVVIGGIAPHRFDGLQPLQAALFDLGLRDVVAAVPDGGLQLSFVVGGAQVQIQVGTPEKSVLLRELAERALHVQALHFIDQLRDLFGLVVFTLAVELDPLARHLR